MAKPFELNNPVGSTKKPLIIYHADCADGFAAAWCFWHHYKDECEYLAASYNTSPPDVTNRQVYLLDFSYKKEVVLRMIEQGAYIVYIDHHKSAIDDLADINNPAQFRTFISNDNSESGAMLAWMYLNNPSSDPNINPPIMIQYIQDRDLWIKKLPHSEEISAYIHSLDYDFEKWDELMNVDSNNFVTCTATWGNVLLQKQKKDVQTVITMSKRRFVIGGHDVPVCNAPRSLGSDVGDIMNKGELFSATYYDTSDHRSFSLRSDKETGIDVTTIAALYGGGGHPNASGFKVPRDHPLAQI